MRSDPEGSVSAFLAFCLLDMGVLGVHLSITYTRRIQNDEYAPRKMISLNINHDDVLVAG